MDERLRQAFVALVKASERLQEVIKTLFDGIAKLMPALQRIAATLRGIEAKRRWKEAQQTARYLGRHPDLVALDGYFDSWYVGIPA
jgi:hypothetical protein